MKTKNKSKLIYFSFIIFALLAAVLISLCACQSNQATSSYNDSVEKHGLAHYDGYKLEQTTVLSRHNIRSPLTEGGSTLTKITPHKWIDWTSNSSELSLRGGELETVMGQYFNKYLQSEGLMPNNWEPNPDETYFYANSFQRTVATAQYFSSGFLPVVNVNVVHKLPLGGKDITFLPVQTSMSDQKSTQIKKEINEKYELETVNKNLNENYKTLENILDFKNSEYAKEHNISSLELDSPTISTKINDENTLSGTLKIANDACDALKLQYYEVENDKDAAFGHDISYKQWEQIGEIADVYEKVLFDSHTAAVGAAGRMIQELQQDINNPVRKFTFLCGHDSTLMSVLSALNVKDYNLPNAISKKTPIGSKIVFNKYLGPDGQQYCSISMVYQSVDQLRHKEALDMKHPPQEYQFEFEGMQKNNDGLYKLSDVEAKFISIITEYNNQGA